MELDTSSLKNITDDQAKIINDYKTCFVDVEALCNRMRAQDIGSGVTSVVMVRMSALICRLNDMDRDEFLVFAGEHYDMITRSCDEAVENEEADADVDRN